MPIGSSSGEYFADEGALLVDQNKSFGPMTAKEKSDRKEMSANELSGDFQSRFGAIDIRPLTPSTMPPGSPTEPAGALKPEGGTNVPGNQYETRLSPEEETKFQAWKQQNAPNDSGVDYDLRGAYQAGLQPVENGHWPDTFKKPNHPTFSDQSIYAKDRPDLAGRWEGDKYVPPRDSSQDIKINPWITITPEDIERGINIGMSVGPGIMAGVKSATIGNKLADLGRAKVLEDYGIRHPDEIFQKTGFFRGAEGKWRYEIDDSKASFNKLWTDTARASSSRPMSDKTSALTKILDHPELYKAYPQLKDIRVIMDPVYPSTGAEWSSQAKTIRMGTEAAKNQGTLMHEVQHAIQDIEGFAKGGSPGKAGQDYHLKYTRDVEALIPESEAIIKKINIKGLTEEEYARSKYLTTVFKKYQEYKAAGNIQAASYYLRLAGEVEARNVDTRLLMTAKERRMFHPELTEEAEIPRHIQIPINEPTSTSAYGVRDPETGKIMKSEPIEFRRAANDNLDLDIGKKMDTYHKAVEESWNIFNEKLKRSNEIIGEMTKIKTKGKMSEFDQARYNKLQKEHDELYSEK